MSRFGHCRGGSARAVMAQKERVKEAVLCADVVADEARMKWIDRQAVTVRT